MRSSSGTLLEGDDGSSSVGAETAGVDDLLGDFFLDYRSLPLTVDETLLEVELSGPGSEAIRLLETLDGRWLDEAQSLQVAAAWERQARWLSTRSQAANLAFVGTAEDMSRDGMREQSSRTLELALATDCNDTFLKETLGTARTLATTLKATGSAVESGELSTYRARRIVEKLAGLDPQVAQAIEAKVLPTAAQLKMGSLLAKLRKLVLAARGDDAVEEHLQGIADRRVRIDTEPSQSGLLDLHASLPAETTVAIRTALEDKAREFARADKLASAQAKAAGGEPEPRRTRDQRLADALAWFVLGPDADNPHQPARPKVMVHVTMSLPTLLHLRDNPGELLGYGPIPADIARMLAEDAEWQRFVHEPVTGYLLDVGDQIYVQPDKLRTFTQFRDVKDRFPGSNRSAFLGDGDHVKAFDPQQARRGRANGCRQHRVPVPDRSHRENPQRLDLRGRCQRGPHLDQSQRSDLPQRSARLLGPRRPRTTAVLSGRLLDGSRTELRVRVTAARTAWHYDGAMTTTQLIIDERAGTS